MPGHLIAHEHACSGNGVGRREKKEEEEGARCAPFDAASAGDGGDERAPAVGARKGYASAGRKRQQTVLDAGGQLVRERLLRVLLRQLHGPQRDAVAAHADGAVTCPRTQQSRPVIDTAVALGIKGAYVESTHLRNWKC